MTEPLKPELQVEFRCDSTNASALSISPSQWVSTLPTTESSSAAVRTDTLGRESLESGGNSPPRGGDSTIGRQIFLSEPELRLVSDYKTVLKRICTIPGSKRGGGNHQGSTPSCHAAEIAKYCQRSVLSSLQPSLRGTGRLARRSFVNF